VRAKLRKTDLLQLKGADRVANAIRSDDLSQHLGKQPTGGRFSKAVGIVTRQEPLGCLMQPHLTTAFVRPDCRVSLINLK
jgi:hypothetical protein